MMDLKFGAILRKLAISVSAVSIALSSVAMAGGWTPPLTIASAFVEDSNLVIVYTSDGAQFTPGCVVNSWSFSTTTEERRGRAWATILSALMSKKKVRFWYADVCDVWNYHNVKSIMVSTDY